MKTLMQKLYIEPKIFQLTCVGEKLGETQIFSFIFIKYLVILIYLRCLFFRASLKTIQWKFSKMFSLGIKFY